MENNRLLQNMCVINDPLGQTHSPASVDHYSHWKFVLFREILKSGDGRDGQRVGLLDQYMNNL